MSFMGLAADIYGFLKGSMGLEDSAINILLSLAGVAVSLLAFAIPVVACFLKWLYAFFHKKDARTMCRQSRSRMNNLHLLTRASTPSQDDAFKDEISKIADKENAARIAKELYPSDVKLQVKRVLVWYCLLLVFVVLLFAVCIAWARYIGAQVGFQSLMAGATAALLSVIEMLLLVVGTIQMCLLLGNANSLEELRRNFENMKVLSKVKNDQRISMAQAEHLLSVAGSAYLVDTRSWREYIKTNLPGAVHVGSFIEERIGKNKPLLLYSSYGVRSREAAKLLTDRGYDLYDLGSTVNGGSALKRFAKENQILSKWETVAYEAMRQCRFAGVDAGALEGDGGGLENPMSSKDDEMLDGSDKRRGSWSVCLGVAVILCFAAYCYLLWVQTDIMSAILPVFLAFGALEVIGAVLHR